jgi:acetylornithine/succinyldiaminopimelate/putrescine aminotransferase
MRLDPDIITLAKPLAGGLPMGAILLKEHVASALQPGEHGTTFGGGPFVSHVAHHVVQRLADPAFLRQVTENGAWFRAQLETLMAEQPQAIRAVRGAGLMWGVDTTEPAGGIIERARHAGLLLLSAGEHTLRILPPLVISRDDLGRGIAMLRTAILG